MKFCVLLPAYNEERTVGDVIKEIKELNFDVIVVDDGSVDRTALKAKAAGAVVLRHEKNIGKGQALRTGFDYICGKDYGGVVIMDADGQHSPGEIKNFVACAMDTKAGVIVGNRMDNPKGMPFVRRVTNRITSYAVSKIIGSRVSDSQCGFRFISASVLKKVKLSTIKYEIESEILIEAVRNNFKILSIPITTIYADQKSSIQPVIDTIRFWVLIFRSLIRKR